MELNTRGRYAVMAMADIACQDSSAAHALSAIAERQKLPLAYLEQLFVQLRRAGLVDSARGRSGGYRLAHPAAQISVADVMSAVEEDTKFTRCTGEGAGCTGAEPCITHGLWSALSHTTSAFFQSVSLEDVVAGKLTASRPEAASTGSKPVRAYLDYNATAPLRREVRLAMIEAMDCVGNSSSVHADGRRARSLIESAREEVAALVGAKVSEVVFTSGATESNAWVLSAGWNTVFASGIEHDSIRASLPKSSPEARAVVSPEARAVMLPEARSVMSPEARSVVRLASGASRHVMLSAGSDGLVAIERLAEHVLKSDGNFGRALVCLQLANNETGVIQPLADLSAFAHEHGITVHSDAVQAAGRIAIDIGDLGVDMLAISGHKMGGPKGVGALIIRDGVEIQPLIRGGGQERRRRAGTENIAAIVGFGRAAALAKAELATWAKVATMRDNLERAIAELSPDVCIIGAGSPRLANTSLLALRGRSAENLVIKLDLVGVSVSAGSACSSGKVGQSHVLLAMGLDSELARSAIRVSLGPNTTEADIAAFLAAWKTIVSQPARAA